VCVADDPVAECNGTRNVNLTFAAAVSYDFSDNVVSALVKAAAERLLSSATASENAGEGISRLCLASIYVSFELSAGRVRAGIRRVHCLERRIRRHVGVRRIRGRSRLTVRSDFARDVSLQGLLPAPRGGGGREVTRVRFESSGWRIECKTGCVVNIVSPDGDIEPVFDFGDQLVFVIEKGDTAASPPRAAIVAHAVSISKAWESVRESPGRSGRRRAG